MLKTEARELKNYNDRIRELREDRDLTQRAVAELLGIKQQVYSTYELGVRALPIDYLVKLCRFYGASADWILGLDRPNELKKQI
jgi:transcriptional regulator with XRE-family HTH domain